jgi:hypothetical protein
MKLDLEAWDYEADGDDQTIKQALQSGQRGFDGRVSISIKAIFLEQYISLIMVSQLLQMPFYGFNLPLGDCI